MKRASVYLRKKQCLVHASSKTTDGVWIIWEPCLAVQAADADRDLGDAIQTALDASQTGVPHPRNWKELQKPLLALAGVRSWSTFSKGAACVEVEEEGGRIALIPTRNLGTDEGFQALPSRQISLERGEVEQLGASVKRLLSAS